MGVKIIRQAGKIFIVGHFVAWCAAVGIWLLAWRDGAAPSGPQFNFAKDFIGAVDYLVYSNVDALSMRVAQRASTWFSANFGAWYEVTLAGLLLAAGTLQWFLLGRLTQWLARRRSLRAALMLFGFLCSWFVVALVFWVAS